MSSLVKALALAAMACVASMALAQGKSFPGIGRDATATGRQQGLKISLFDVSDVSEPRELAKFVGDDDSQSNAEWEHKAFLFDKEKELLVIPASSYGAAEPLVALLPSGALGNGLRAALMDGVVPVVPLLVLVVWTAVGTALTSRTFKWE